MSVNFVPHKPVVVDLAARRAWRAQGSSDGFAPETVGLENELDYDDGARTSALDEIPPAAAPAIASKIPGKHDQASSVPLAAIGPGTLLRDRYLLERQVGSGGACLVFAAMDRHRTSVTGVPGRLAVKLLRPESRGNPACIYRLAREFRQMQRLTHPNVARVFDIDCDGAVWFITLELLQGDTLRQRIKSRVTVDEAFELLRDCSAALTYAHSLGITHGDLKPSNIFVTLDGGVRLLDFGSVPDREESAADPNGSHRYAATPAYASPQILMNEIADPRDDVFSLACVAYELLGGEHPFERRSSLEAKRQGLRPPYVRRIQPRHYSVLAEALAWERESRPASARELLHALMASDLTLSQPAPRVAAVEASQGEAVDASTAAASGTVHADAQSRPADSGSAHEPSPTSAAAPRPFPPTSSQQAARPDLTGRALVPLADARRKAPRPAAKVRLAAANPRLAPAVITVAANQGQGDRPRHVPGRLHLQPLIELDHGHGVPFTVQVDDGPAVGPAAA